MGAIVENLTSSLNILKYINPFDDNFILKGVLEFLSNIVSYINPFSDDFILKGVLEFLSNIISYINPFNENFFGYKLIEMFENLFIDIFIPSEDSIQSLIDVVKNKFSFVDSIKNSFNSIKDMLQGVNGYPKLTLDIESKYYSGNVSVIDMSWYAKYKPYGDLIFTGFAYVLFVYRIWFKLPSIISGSGSFFDFFKGGSE